MADDSGEKWGKLIGVAEIAMGVGFFIRGLGKVGGKYPQSVFGGAIGQPPGTKAIQKSQIKTVKTIDERVRWIKENAIKGSVDPAVIEEVSGILGKKCGERWCVAEKGGRDGLSEVNAFFWALRDPKSPYALRYKRDHLYVDTFISPRVQQKLKNGDCDDGTARLAAWLMQAGYEVRLRVVQAKGAPSWSHIYVLAGVPPGKATRWYPLDWSVLSFKPGQEAPGARETAATGQPHGVIQQVRDFPIEYSEFRRVLAGR